VEVGDVDGDHDLDLIVSVINTPGGASNGVFVLTNLIDTVVRIPSQH